MLQVDSRKIKEGDTFLALRGVHDGHLYIEDAIQRGATEVIVEEGLYSVETLLVNDTREYLIQYLDEQYKEKIKDLKIIGVTGTNGKTTTCFLLHKALNQLGHKAGYIGTIGFYLDEKVRELENTTPDVLDIYTMLLECVEAGCEYVAMEVSSIAIDKRRIGSLTFDYVVFTNLTKDHLDYHKTMEQYALAKQQLFLKLKENGCAMVNYDDPSKTYFILEKNHTIIYGIEGGDYQISNYSISHLETIFNIKNEGKLFNFETKLIGKHNLYNLLVVIMILFKESFSYEEIKQVIKEAKAPVGRMDTVLIGKNQIVIDYAHTPDAVLNIINASRELKPNHIITIVGCGGDRDKTKRPEMAKIATDLSDSCIFTSDNPRTEDPEQILKDMIQGLDNHNYEIEVNREKAIIKGIQMLEENDILLVLGKGHEDYQIHGTTKTHFDDKEIVLKAI